jgi:hypothetical protein
VPAGTARECGHHRFDRKAGSGPLCMRKDSAEKAHYPPSFVGPCFDTVGNGCYCP